MFNGTEHKVNHFLFIDDWKLFAKNEDQIALQYKFSMDLEKMLRQYVGLKAMDLWQYIHKRQLNVLD